MQSLISPSNRLYPNLLAYISNPDSTQFNVPRQLFSPQTKTGQLFIFGSAVAGELGLGKNIHERRKPGNIKKLNSFIVAVECGGQHSLALDSNGRVWSWGVNDQGALGRFTDEDEKKERLKMGAAVDDSDSDDDDYQEKGNESFLPCLVDISYSDGSQAIIVQMVCADSFSAVLTSTGHVFAWGSFRDPSGVIGFSKGSSVQPTPRLMSFGDEKVVLLGSGENHIFAVTADDTVWAFGANDENQLGRRVSSRFKNNLEPYEIRGIGKRSSILHGIVKITGGAYHTLYINKKGELYSFGCNNCGQLGLGDILPHVNGPERVTEAIAEDGKTKIELPPIVDIAAGESHSVVVSIDGRVFTFGANLEGQLGYETLRPIFGDERDSEPLAVPEEKQSLSRKRARTIAESNIGHNASSSSSTDNSPMKQDRGNFKLKYQPIPREIPRKGEGLRDIKDDPVVMVDAQSRFTVAVTSLGNLYTWGSGHCFQLGNEEMEDEPTPYKVELKTRKCFGVSCGGQFTCFLLEPKPEDLPEQAVESRTTTVVAAEREFRSKEIFSSSMPNSPQGRLKERTSSSSIGEKGMEDVRSFSPTNMLSTEFTRVHVSPEKKRSRIGTGGGAEGYTTEEKMAPWSPTKKKEEKEGKAIRSQRKLFKK